MRISTLLFVSCNGFILGESSPNNSFIMVMTPPYHPIAKKAATLLDCPAVEGQLRAQASICRKRDILLAKYICQIGRAHV